MSVAQSQQSPAPGPSTWARSTRLQQEFPFDNSAGVYSPKTGWPEPSELPLQNPPLVTGLQWAWEVFALFVPLSFLIIAGISRYLDERLTSLYPFGHDVLRVTSFVRSVNNNLMVGRHYLSCVIYDDSWTNDSKVGIMVRISWRKVIVIGTTST